ncbi:hypothetical protein AB1L88_26845 [Tautonia sp. JC769]|uniref:hypothetical protein n=1 Tax=Tautonia sp. JC769 TaxID=3232135 RepID=UPI00345994E8
MRKLPWIGCELLRLEYDFQDRTAVLYLHEGECVDMSSAVEFVTKIDQDARTIRTIAGNEEDTTYSRETDQEWSAKLPA